MSDVEVPFAKTLRLMHGYLVEAKVGLGYLEKIAAKYGIMQGVQEVTRDEVEALAREIREVMRTLGFEPTAILVQAMLLAGDPMLARLMGIDLERPKEERKN